VTKKEGHPSGTGALSYFECDELQLHSLSGREGGDTVERKSGAEAPHSKKEGSRETGSLSDFEPDGANSSCPRWAGKERGRCELNAEGATAAASALDVGVVKLEAGAFESLNVVDLDAVKIHGTHLVNGNL
jgi:hypothetical protein